MAEQTAGSARLLTVPGILTLSRLVLLPVVIAGIATDRGYLAAGAMALVWITDLLDGRIARRLGQASDFGRTLDSTVDFVLIYSLFITFYAAGRLATYQFAFLYLAMLTILLLQLSEMAAGSGGQAAATALGKLTGALEYVYLLFLVAREVVPPSGAVGALNYVLFAALAIAIVLHSAECLSRLRGRARETAGS